MFLKKVFHLRTSIIWLVVFIIVVVISILSFSAYSVSKNQYREQLSLRIKSIAQTTAHLIAISEHSKLNSRDDELNPEYSKIRNLLKKIKDANSDVRFVYTMKKQNNGSIVFIVNAEEEFENFSHLGDVYRVDAPALNQAFTENGSVFLNEEFIHDKWGIWFSAFAPIKDQSGHIEGVVGIDISAASVKEQEMHLLKIICLSSLACMITGILLAFGFAKILTNPLKKLIQDVNRIQNFDFEDSEKLNSSIYEFRQMSKAIAGMKQGLRSFKKYVPAELVLDLLIQKQEAYLSVEKKDITVMFTDIIDFTVISEKLELDDLLNILSEYFEMVAEVITRNRGTVDKFIGDSIMAFWGAPHENPNHAYDACRTALEIQLVLHQLNKKLVERNLPALNTRVGMSTGLCTVGNIGHKDRFNYTAVGDTVNLASRVEILNKNYSTDILMTDSTYQIIKDDYDCIKLDSVIVKGKKEPVEVYQLVNVKNGQAVYRQRD